MRKPRPWKIQVVTDVWPIIPDIVQTPVTNTVWWRLVAPNGEVVAAAETYTTKAKARKSAKRVLSLMDATKVAYEEVEERGGTRTSQLSSGSSGAPGWLRA